MMKNNSAIISLDILYASKKINDQSGKSRLQGHQFNLTSFVELIAKEGKVRKIGTTFHFTFHFNKGILSFFHEI